MISRNMAKWLGFAFSSGGVAGSDYLQFQKDARTDLNRMCKENGLVLHEFIKSHYGFSAVIKNPENKRFIYISISDVRFRKDEWANNVLYRAMEHDKDWMGGMNRYCPWDEIGKRAYKMSISPNPRFM